MTGVQTCALPIYIKKVYSILTLQLMITFIITYCSSYFESIGAFFSHPAVMVIGFIMMLISLISSIFLARQYPYNYIALFGFTIGTSIIVAGCAAKIESNTVLMAIMATLMMSIGLTAYVWRLGDTSVVISLVVLLSGMFISEFIIIAFIFTRSDYLFSFYCSIIALVYGCYLVIHTYVIKADTEIDDYTISAMMIYLDIIRMFLYILMAISKKR